MSSISEMTRELEERGLYDKEPLTRKPLCKFCGLPFNRRQNGIESFGCGSSYAAEFKPQWVRTIGCYEIENGKLQERIKRLEDVGDLLCAAAAFMGWHLEIEKWNKAKEEKPAA